MIIKKAITSASLILSLAATAFAGSEDWNGQYIFQAANGQSYTVTHSPTRVSFLFFSAGVCLALSKNSSINGMVIPADVTLCRADNIETFTNEVQKLGTIISKTITMGSSYPSQ